MKNINLKTNIKKFIFRDRGPKNTRYKFLRLDKNERVSDFKISFFNRILKKFKPHHLTAYPELENLYKLIARTNKLAKEQLVITPGSDGAIRMCFDLFTKKNDKIICLKPTFAMVEIYSKTHSLKQIKIGYDSDLNLDLDFLYKKINSKISLIILANPNSPTGTIIEERNLTKILNLSQKKNIPVLIDEAYYGFSKFTALPLIKKYKNLVVARTFSKAYGLAGCRAGYLATNKNLAKKFFSLKPMYEINSLATLFISEFIKNRVDKKYVSETTKGKKLLIKFLKYKNINFFDTYANFIHIDFGKNRKKILKEFKRKKILIKGGLSVKNLLNFTRITTGPLKEINKVIKILKRYI